MNATTPPAVAIGLRAEFASCLPSPTHAALVADMAPLRAVLGLAPRACSAPVRVRHGVHLTPEHAAILDELIAYYPDETVGRLARRFTAATGRTVNRMAVWRRMPRRPERSKINPLGPVLSVVLAEEIRRAGPSAPRQQVVDSFARRTGRVISPRTVSLHTPRVAAPSIGGGL